MVGGSGAGFGKATTIVDAKVATSKAVAAAAAAAAARPPAGRKIGHNKAVPAKKPNAQIGNKKAVPAKKPNAQAIAGSCSSPPAADPPLPADPPAPANDSSPPPPLLPQTPPEPVIGKVVVRYNHYTEVFSVSNGILEFEHVDRKYSLSFVFKGNFFVSLTADDVPGAEPHWPDGDGLKREMRKDPDGFDPEDMEELYCGTFSGLEVGSNGQPKSYLLNIGEDEAAEAAFLAAKGGRTGYRGPNANGTVIGATSASSAITAELKAMSVDEIRGQSDRYKELLAARDAEDVLFGSG